MKTVIKNERLSWMLALRKRCSIAELEQKYCIMEVLQEKTLEIKFKGVTEGMGIDQLPG